MNARPPRVRTGKPAWRWQPDMNELRSRLDRQRALAREFGLDEADAYLAPPFDASVPFGPSWSGYRVECFGMPCANGPTVAERPAWPLWQVIDPSGNPILTLQLRRAWAYYGDSPASLEWTWRPPAQPTVAMIGLERERRPDVAAKLARARQLYAGLQLGGRPSEAEARYAAIREAVDATRAAIEAGPDPSVPITQVTIATRLGRLDAFGVPLRDFKRDVRNMGGWKALTQRPVPTTI